MAMDFEEIRSSNAYCTSLYPNVMPQIQTGLVFAIGVLRREVPQALLLNHLIHGRWLELIGFMLDEKKSLCC